MSAEQVVNAFMAAFDRKDLDGALALVSDDCYYDNVPLGDMRGPDKMREFLGPLIAGNGPVKFEVLRQAALDVRPPQPLVESDAGRVALHQLAHGFGKQGGPGLGLVGERVGGHREGACRWDFVLSVGPDATPHSPTAG